MQFWRHIQLCYLTDILDLQGCDDQGHLRITDGYDNPFAYQFDESNECLGWQYI